MIARFWPVDGVVGENGGFYFRQVGIEMRRHFFFDEATQKQNRSKLSKIQDRVLREVPGCRIASDQFSRLMDLAVDFAEDVKPALPASEIEKIVKIFESEGAVAKVSSIHVNGWFGKYDKLSMCQTFMEREFQLKLDAINERCVFVGDSPNDEPMFGFFKNSIGVANVQSFAKNMKDKPKFICQSHGGAGFSEAASLILS
jgi:hydroxymethylpyrimidine pyrophosphatase-like HAD family hydrolase